MHYEKAITYLILNLAKYKFVWHSVMTYRDPCEQLAVIILQDMQWRSVHLRHNSASCVPCTSVSEGLW